jgi:hypothetical protein
MNARLRVRKKGSGRAEPNSLKLWVAFFGEQLDGTKDWERRLSVRNSGIDREFGFVANQISKRAADYTHKVRLTVIEIIHETKTSIPFCKYTFLQSLADRIANHQTFRCLNH